MEGTGGRDSDGVGPAAHEASVSALVPRALSSTARYRDIPELRRLEAVGSPTHVMVHHIDGVATDEHRDYCDAHVHPFAELNLVLGEPGALTYEIVLADETIVVSSPSTVWIPAGVPHSANLRSGTGTFVAVYLAEPQAGPPA
ncbi:hypothetical protein [Aquihabitans sp. McL0605]|uniref:hypothetical protein n=1 Tax=Aquihabitans sp. McL0605 TaxID=3415671 RepID=UPI003CEE7DCA